MVLYKCEKCIFSTNHKTKFLRHQNRKFSCFENKNQGLNGTNASACHACSFLPETSCEESNQLLDRTCIIGDVRENLKGYFEDLIN